MSRVLVQGHLDVRQDDVSVRDGPMRRRGVQVRLQLGLRHDTPSVAGSFTYAANER